MEVTKCECFDCGRIELLNDNQLGKQCEMCKGRLIPSSYTDSEKKLLELYYKEREKLKEETYESIKRSSY